MTAMFRTATTLLLLTAAAAVAAPVPKAVKAKNTDGVWEVADWQSRGNKVNSAINIRWTIDGDKLTIERTSANSNVAIRPPANPPAYTLVKADKDDPTAVDYTATYNGGDRVVTYQGRLVVDGDTLRFCFEPAGGTRPAECAPSKTNTYYEFQRVKGDK